MSLERKAFISWNPSDTSKNVNLSSQFAIQLLYALQFLEEEPTSPFTINPWVFPLEEVMVFVRSNYPSHIHLFEKLISKYCLEKNHQVNNSRLLDSADSAIGGLDDTTILYQSIRNCMDKNTSDPSGIKAEKIYLAISSRLPISSLVEAVCRSVLVSEHSQAKFINYIQLCKDPLAILKAPVFLWNCDGLRRLVLKTFCHLMAANESMVIESSKTTQVASEYLASRNSIILRCLLLIQTNLSPKQCAVSASIIRSIVSRSPGITATLIKQGLENDFVDYLCGYVPESFSDAPILSSTLSNKESISLQDRLMIADASLRIAIAHCSRGEVIAKGLLSTALTTLIEAFQLVIGPRGVPVSVLRGKVDGEENMIEACRRAMFQMIEALTFVSPESILKGPCISSIGRIASLCKAEMSSVGSGSAGARRKALLKEIWDACSDVNARLGGEIQL